MMWLRPGVWSADEIKIPAGYVKSVVNEGNAWAITNTYIDNPKTGDVTNVLGMSVVAAFSAIGVCVSALTLHKARRKEMDEKQE